MVYTACSQDATNDGSLPKEYLARSVTTGGAERGYRVFVPTGRDPNAKLPVILYLHGSGARGDNNREPAWGFDAILGQRKESFGFIVVLPQCPDNTFWADSKVSDYALAALDQAVKEFNGDPERVYLMGFSLGGYGVWQIGAAYPDRFAALVPVAGGVVGERPIEKRDRDAIIPSVGAMLDSDDPYKAVATALGTKPIWVFHGARDESVPVQFSRKMVSTLEESGSRNAKYTEFTEDGHMIIGRVFEEPGFLDWLADQKRQKP